MNNPTPTHVLSISAGTATVRLANGDTEHWSLASLPRDVQAGDVVAVQVIDGDLECWIEQVQSVRA